MATLPERWIVGALDKGYLLDMQTPLSMDGKKRRVQVEIPCRRTVGAKQIYVMFARANQHMMTKQSITHGELTVARQRKSHRLLSHNEMS